MIATPNATVAATVRAEMARRNVTTRDLAAKLEKSAAWVSRRTTGAVPITPDDAHLIADALGVEASLLLTT
ncbi:helix-turn-helix transcriptional regulator [Kribbella sp. NPDC003505]|uniref:helix-turn-helix domain-containing protein n=1 Tax=Kribbella sp. NPDC003505 TaxID=3154448 RepID=UPI00339F06D7